MKIPIPLDAKSRAKVRPTSAVLFHSVYALEMLAFIAQTPRFYSAQLAEITGCKDNYAGTYLKRLKEHGLVAAEDRDPGQQRKYYVKEDWPVWAVLPQLLETLLQAPDAEVATLSDRRLAGGTTAA